MAHFIPTKDEATTQETRRLFFSHIFKDHGLPKDIVSDRNPKFKSKFWRALWKRIGSELKMSTSFRPQTDGQTERVNLVIQQFLRIYDALPSPGVNPLEGSPKCSCGKLGLGRRSQLLALKRGRGAC